MKRITIEEEEIIEDEEPTLEPDAYDVSGAESDPEPPVEPSSEPAADVASEPEPEPEPPEKPVSSPATGKVISGNEKEGDSGRANNIGERILAFLKNIFR